MERYEIEILITQTRSIVEKVIIEAKDENDAYFKATIGEYDFKEIVRDNNSKEQFQGVEKIRLINSNQNEEI